MDKKLVAEIVAICDSIGYSDDDKYFKDPSANACIKDLIIHLRRDNDDHFVRRLLGQTHVVEKDLLPLLKYYAEEEDLYDVVLRLVMNLTHPPLLLYNEDVPNNKIERNYYNELQSYARGYKNAFVDREAWDKLKCRLQALLMQGGDQLMENDKLTVERILILIRNVLHVPADPEEEARAEDDASLHDRVLLMMHESGMMDLLLFLSSSVSFHELSFHMLEIISCMLREQTGESLSKSQLGKRGSEKQEDGKLLAQSLAKETAERTHPIQRGMSRHSRFRGTFVVRDLKAPSGRELLCHKPISSVADLSLDSTKRARKTARNRRQFNEFDPFRRSTAEVRVKLKDFCIEFLNTSYNTIMNIARDKINRHWTQEHDETYYLWCMTFFMEFNRHYKFSVEYVSETMSVNMFHYIQTQLDNYHEMMTTDKENVTFWSRRAHTALKAYKELLFTLMWMDKDKEASVKESSRVIKSNVFYMPEYRELCLTLLNSYDPVKLSKLYLKDLVETNHIFLKMLEEFSKATNELYVKSKNRRRKKNAVKKSRQSVKKMSGDQLEELWTNLSGEISLICSSEEVSERRIGGDNVEVNVIPFDAASDVPIDEQKGIATERIAVFLLRKELHAAVKLLRNCREVWPDSVNEFGEADAEIEALERIYKEKARLTSVLKAAETDRPDDPTREAGVLLEEREEEEVREEDKEDEFNDSGDMTYVPSKEQKFDFLGFLVKYANWKVVSRYGKMFKDWNDLSAFTLHCVMKMFHRMAFQMGYPALICQASIFRTFQQIGNVIAYRSDLKEAWNFFLHLWPKFIDMCETSKKTFMEILFWKSAKDAIEIQEGYGFTSERSNKPKKKSRNEWTEDEEIELGLLVDQFKALPQIVRDNNPMVDWIWERLSKDDKSKKSIRSKLLEKDLVDVEDFGKRKRPPKIWSEEEVDELRELYEKFKESDDIMRNVLEGLRIKRGRRKVIEKMIEIGLINDKTEVRKRRKRSKGKKREEGGEGDSDDSGNEERNGKEMKDSSDEEDSESARGGSSSNEENEETFENDEVLERKKGFGENFEEKSLEDKLSLSLRNLSEFESDKEGSDNEHKMSRGIEARRARMSRLEELVRTKKGKERNKASNVRNSSDSNYEEASWPKAKDLDSPSYSHVGKEEDKFKDWKKTEEKNATHSNDYHHGEMGTNDDDSNASADSDIGKSAKRNGNENGSNDAGMATHGVAMAEKKRGSVINLGSDSDSDDSVTVIRTRKKRRLKVGNNDSNSDPLLTGTATGNQKMAKRIKRMTVLDSDSDMEEDKEHTSQAEACRMNNKKSLLVDSSESD